MILKFDKWMPDRIPADAGAAAVLNVIHTNAGYEVIHSPSPLGLAPFPGGTPRKLFLGRSSSNVTVPICMGSAFSARAVANGWSTLAGSTMDSESWSTVPWGDAVYAVNGKNPPQKIKMLDSGDFEQINTPNGLTGKFAIAVADFLMLLDCREFEGSTRYPYRAQWSGYQRPERFEVDPAIQSDFQDVADIGQLMGGTGGEFALILGELGVARADYVGPDVIFKFFTIETDTGCEISESIIRTDNRTFWWSKRGFRVSSGDVSIDIGTGQVNEWFRRNISFDKINLARMSVKILADRPIIYWSFISRFSISTEPDYLITYNWETKAWTYGLITVSILGESSVASPTTDEENLNLPEFDFATSTTDDYQQLTDAYGMFAPFFAAMLNGILCSMDQKGDITAELETREMEFNPDGYAILNQILPLVESATTITMQIKGRNTLNNPIYRIKDGMKPERNGTFSCRMKTRYHRIKVYLNGPFVKGIGISVTNVLPAGNR